MSHYRQDHLQSSSDVLITGRWFHHKMSRQTLAEVRPRRWWKEFYPDQLVWYTKVHETMNELRTENGSVSIYTTGNECHMDLPNISLVSKKISLHIYALVWKSKVHIHSRVYIRPNKVQEHRRMHVCFVHVHTSLTLKGSLSSVVLHTCTLGTYMYTQVSFGYIKQGMLQSTVKAEGEEEENKNTSQ
jgi:hypothetical protein